MRVKTLYERRAIVLESDATSSLSSSSSFPPAPTEGDSKRYLVIGDLHIGFEERFKNSGIRIQSNIEKMISEIESIIEANKITNLVVNGDVKAGIDRIFESEWESVPKFFSKLMRLVHVSVVPGNHDGGLANLLPEGVQLEDINGLMLSDTLVMHGHTKPLIKFKECKRIIMGHIHPVFQKKGSPLSGQPVWVFLKVPRKSVFGELLEERDSSTLVEVIVMPSYNLDLALSGYVDDSARAERSTAPMVRELIKADEALIVTLGGEVIGDASLLRGILL